MRTVYQRYGTKEIFRFWLVFGLSNDHNCYDNESMISTEDLIHVM